MLKVRFQAVRLTKKYPLAISRGVSTGSLNLFVFAEQDGHVGLGECAPGTGFDETLADLATTQLTQLVESGIEGLSVAEIVQRGVDMGVDASALAGLDVALWDLLAKRAGLPLYELFGLSPRSVPTSVTIGINPVDVIRERVPEILSRTGGRFLKIKLGTPEGFERDQENYLAAQEASASFGVGLRVDANGGWDAPTAIMMMNWLSERNCDYVEQPLARGDEENLKQVFAARKLPLYVDESVRVASDVIALRDRVDGINLKLMKTGGLTEALRLVAVARACGLGTMIGCMGESSVAISAGAAIGSLFDHIDLDSQINLAPDPAKGAPMISGIVTPLAVPGHGGELLA